jgi:hypothetical protein
MRVFLTSVSFIGVIMIMLGVLRLVVFVGALFCAGILLGSTHASVKTSEICHFLHLRFLDFYGILRHTARPSGTFNIHDPTRSSSLYLFLHGINVHNTLFYFLHSWFLGLCLCPSVFCRTTGGTAMVFDQLSSRWHSRSLLRVCGHGSYIEASSNHLRPLPSCLYDPLPGMGGQSRYFFYRLEAEGYCLRHALGAPQ